jgi:hypothetical protein
MSSRCHLMISLTIHFSWKTTSQLSNDQIAHLHPLKRWLKCHFKVEANVDVWQLYSVTHDELGVQKRIPQLGLQLGLFTSVPLVLSALTL